MLVDHFYLRIIYYNITPCGKKEKNFSVHKL